MLMRETVFLIQYLILPKSYRLFVAIHVIHFYVNVKFIKHYSFDNFVRMTEMIIVWDSPYLQFLYFIKLLLVLF